MKVKTTSQLIFLSMFFSSSFTFLSYFLSYLISFGIAVTAVLRTGNGVWKASFINKLDKAKAATDLQKVSNLLALINPTGWSSYKLN